MEHYAIFSLSKLNQKMIISKIYKKIYPEGIIFETTFNNIDEMSENLQREGIFPQIIVADTFNKDQITNVRKVNKNISYILVLDHVISEREILDIKNNGVNDLIKWYETNRNITTILTVYGHN